MSDELTFCAVLVRRLREGKTYADFLDAWYPDKGFGWDHGWGPITAANISDEDEILTFGTFKAPSLEAMGEEMERIAEQESVRHGRIDEVIESTSFRGVFQVTDEFNFSTDESVAAGRPDAVRDRES